MLYFVYNRVHNQSSYNLDCASAIWFSLKLVIINCYLIDSCLKKKVRVSIKSRQEVIWDSNLYEIETGIQ
jgi:hypothetical protein